MSVDDFQAATKAGIRDPNDLYAVLDISKGADEQEIRRGYKKAALKYHPDRQGPDATEEQRRAADAGFKAVGRAYEVLNDARLRRVYDRGGIKAVLREQGAGVDEDDMGMGGGGGSGAQFFTSSSGGFPNHFAAHQQAMGGGFDPFHGFFMNIDPFEQFRQAFGADFNAPGSTSSSSSSSSGGGGGGKHRHHHSRQQQQNPMMMDPFAQMHQMMGGGMMGGMGMGSPMMSSSHSFSSSSGGGPGSTSTRTESFTRNGQTVTRTVKTTTDANGQTHEEVSENSGPASGNTITFSSSSSGGPRQQQSQRINYS